MWTLLLGARSPSCCQWPPWARRCSGYGCAPGVAADVADTHTRRGTRPRTTSHLRQSLGTGCSRLQRSFSFCSPLCDDRLRGTIGLGQPLNNRSAAGTRRLAPAEWAPNGWPASLSSWHWPPLPVVVFLIFGRWTTRVTGWWVSGQTVSVAVQTLEAGLGVPVDLKWRDPTARRHLSRRNRTTLASSLDVVQMLP